MKAFFLRKIPLNARTVCFCLCSSGGTSFVAVFFLRLIGYEGFDSENPIGHVVQFVAGFETLYLPFASAFFWKIEPTLAALGMLIFLVVLCGFLQMPAVT